MALNYDTQVELLFPNALFQDATCAPILNRVGIPMEAKGNKILLFTDPHTVAALNAANEEVKEVFRKSGFGLVLYGWNPQSRSDFLLRQMYDISAKRYDEEALSRAVFDLLHFVHNGMLGKLESNPFAAPLPAVDPTDQFDIAVALQVMMSPEQINKPKQPEQRRTSRVFGRRNA